MTFVVFLEKKREIILKNWFDLIIDTYPRDASGFLAKQKDRFHNPVGHTISQGIGAVYDNLVSTIGPGETNNTDEMVRAIDDIVRIRTVQDFAPSQAVAFVFQLKTVIRDVIRDSAGEQELSDNSRDWITEIESIIDGTALLAFDKYMECREKLFEIRTNEIKSRTMALIKKANEPPDISHPKGEPIDDEK